MTEHDTQNAIIQLITLKGGVPIRVNSGMVKITDQSGKTRVFKGEKKGTSDLIALYKGRFIAIEVKYGDNHPTREQWAFLARVVENGGIALVAYDVEDVNRILEMIDADHIVVTVENVQQ